MKTRTIAEECLTINNFLCPFAGFWCQERFSSYQLHDRQNGNFFFWDLGALKKKQKKRDLDEEQCLKDNATDIFGLIPSYFYLFRLVLFTRHNIKNFVHLKKSLLGNLSHSVLESSWEFSCSRAIPWRLVASRFEQTTTLHTNHDEIISNIIIKTHCHKINAALRKAQTV